MMFQLFIITVAISILSNIGFYHQPDKDAIDYVLYQDTTFRENLEFLANDESQPRKFVFRNVTFDSCDVSFLTAKKESGVNKDYWFDSLVFEDCRWTGFKRNGLRIRGSHKYTSVKNCTFVRYPGKPAKRLAMSFTTNVHNEQRVGTVIIEGNYIENVGSDQANLGTSIFGQKLSKFHVLNNHFVISGKLGSAIKLDDAIGPDKYWYEVDILIKHNRFEIDNGYSAITLENTATKHSTQNVKIHGNWFNHRITIINGTVKGLEVINNTFDYTNLPYFKNAEKHYLWACKVMPESKWENNQWLRDEDSQGYSVDYFPGSDSLFFRKNDINEWNLILDRRKL